MRRPDHMATSSARRGSRRGPPARPHVLHVLAASSERRGATRRATPRVRAASRAKKWSQQVTQSSNALDLEAGVVTRRTPRAVAEPLKRSALRSQRRKAPPYQSALSMLTFYVNRAGRALAQAQARAHPSEDRAGKGLWSHAPTARRM